jgi:hypothetical protein
VDLFLRKNWMERNLLMLLVSMKKNTSKKGGEPYWQI